MDTIGQMVGRSFIHTLPRPPPKARLLPKFSLFSIASQKKIGLLHVSP